MKYESLHFCMSADLQLTANSSSPAAPTIWTMSVPCHRAWQNQSQWQEVLFLQWEHVHWNSELRGEWGPLHLRNRLLRSSLCFTNFPSSERRLLILGETNINSILSVTIGAQKTTMKGCASKLMCTSASNPQIQGFIGGDISCCQGNYCNSASSTSAGLLVLVTPVVSLLMLS